MLTLGNKLTLNSQPIYKFVNEHSIDFDGVDDCIVTDGADTVAQPTTYSFWAKSSETGQNRGVFGHGSPSEGGFHFNWSGDRPLLYLGIGYYVYWNDTTAIDDGEWHHWVVYSEPNNLSNCKLYCDGILQTVNLITSSGSLAAYTESLTIGSDQASGGNSFLGKIDEFAVYDRELTQAEITRMYNTYYSPNRVANGNFAQIGNEEVTNGDFSQIGSELIVNGDFASDTWWQKSSANVNISNGKGNYTGGTTEYFYKNNTLEIGKTYKLVFEITDYTTGYISAFGGNWSGPATALGTWEKYFKCVDTTFGLVGNTFVGSIDNVSVKEVGQDWSAKGGVITSVENGKLFFDNSTGNNSGGAFQNIGLVTGKQYQMTATMQLLTGATSGTFTLFTSSASGTGQSGVYTGSTLLVGGAAVTETFTFTPGSGDVSIQFSCDESNATYSISDISVKEVGQHWTISQGTTISDKANLDGSSATAWSTPLQQTGVLVTGRTYKVKFVVSNYTSGSVKIYATSGATVISANGTYTDNIVAAGNNLDFQNQATPITCSIDNIVVQELKHDATNLMLNAGDYQSANPLITSTKSMEFNVDDYLQLSEPVSYTNHTICGWAYSSNLSATDFIFSASDSASDGIRLSYRSSANFRYEVNGQNITSPPDTREANRWYFVCGTYDGTTARLYVDGIELASATTSETISTTTNARIGNLSYVDGNFFDGNITEVGAFNRCLTALEVASLYNQGMPTNLLVNRNNYQSGNPTVFNTKQVDFDGTDDHLKANSTLGSFTGSITSWVKRNSVASVWRYITDFRANSGGGYFAINNSHNIDVPSGTVYVDNVATTVVPQDTEWHHIVVTGITLNITESIIFGSRYNIVDVFDGDISQIGLWNSTLTADEVSSLYNHGLPIDLSTDQAAYESSSNLVGYWRMGSGTLDTYPLIADQTNATLGAEEITGFTNGTTYPFTTFTTSGNNITSAIVSSAFAGAVSNAISVTSGQIYKVTFDYTKNSGDDLRVVFSSVVSGAGTQISNSELISASGSYTKYFTITSTTTGYFQMGTGNSGHSLNASISNVSAKQVNGNPAIMTNQTSSDIENGSPYANLVQNGTFDTDSNWTKGTGWSIANGLASCDGSQSSSSLFYQNLGSLSGKTINISFTLSNYSAGHLTTAFFGASGTLDQQVSANGNYSFDIYIESGHNGNTGFTANSSFVGSIDNVTVTEVNTGLQGYWKMGDGTNDEYPVIYDQVNPTLSAEKVTNGDFATDSDWIKETGWTISGGTANRTNTGTFTALQQNILTSGKTYKVTFTISSITSGEIYGIRLGSNYILRDKSTTGTYTGYGTANGSTLSIMGNQTFAGSVDNVSIKEVQGNPATMTNMLEGNITNQYPLTKIRNYYRMGDGILDGYPIIQDQTSPNLAHIPTTNLITYSEKIDDSSWTKNASSIVANQTTAPDNTLSADLLKEDSSNAEHWIRSLNITAVSGTRYSMSFYAKQKERTWVKVNFLNSGVVSYNAWVNLANGEVGTKNANLIITTSLEENGFYRIKVSADAVTTTINLLIGLATGDNVNAYQGDGTSGIYIWGCQVEEQSQATAYIKSDGIAAVRKSSTTNLLPYSEDFSQWSALNNVVVTVNQTTSPIGTLTADKFTFDGTSNGRVEKTIAVTNGNTYTFSVYLKNNDLSDVTQVWLGLSAAAQGQFFTITNDWKRYSVTVAADGSSEYPRVQFSGTGSLFAWGIQLEEQTQAETYAKTTGLPVTIDLFTENNYGTMTNMSASDIVEDTP